MYELAERILKLANDNYINPELYDYSDNSVAFLIEWGDWKHDHARFNWLVAENFPELRGNESITEEDGSDCYSSVHRFRKVGA